MLTSVSPQDYYEQVSVDEKDIIDKWKGKREFMVQDRTRKEVDSLLQDDATLFRSSIPFLKLFVKAYHKDNLSRRDGAKDKNCAILTIWRVSESQLEILKEGNIIRFKSLAVKDVLHDGFLQLNANRKTFMQLSPQKVNTINLKKFGFHPRTSLPISKIHLLSKKSKYVSDIDYRAPTIDTVAYLLKSVETHKINSKIVQIYVTDETSMLLRIEKEIIDNKKDLLSRQLNSKVKESGTKRIVSFRDIKLVTFDEEENCAVAVWTRSSSQYKCSMNRFNELCKWSTSSACRKICAELEDKMALDLNTLGDLPRGKFIAVGYIVSLTSQDLHESTSNDNEFEKLSICSQPWRVTIDCGKNHLVEAIFPLCLLDELSSLIKIGHEKSLPESFKKILENVDLRRGYVLSTRISIERILRESGQLLHFSLQQVTFEGTPDYIISKLKRAEINSLVRLNLPSKKLSHQ